ncbi:hypothetical protein LCGC14_3155300 [marine sediment metagenome]|uniref:Uncharacterized protein n=1 Tax=marine sediment metagenome TaxID=412755 RepID=A0A0F8VSZ8_9ZZZZ
MVVNYKNKEWLKDKYIKEMKTMRTIAKECKVSEATILNWLRKFKIKTRNHSEAGKLMKTNRGWFRKGNQNWLGRHHTNKSKIKMSKSQKAREINNKNENNPMWKGDNVGYGALHIWINKNKEKTGICSICNEIRYTDWGNKDHQYKRDINDYFEVCHSCHKIYDKKRGFIR